MILGIMGGMGPAATCELFSRIIDFTNASRDQEHIHIVIDSNAQIPDRSKYICGTGEDPRIEMIRSAAKLEMMGADYIAIPCNTAHYFYDDIASYTRVPIIHMIKETALYLKQAYPQNQNYILLATEGTYTSGVYRDTFKNFGLNIIEPIDDDKKIIMDWIYRVKSGKFDINPLEFMELVNRYKENRNTPVILGCTELPLLAQKIGVPDEYIDPVSILAQCCVNLAKQGEQKIG